MKVAKEYSAKSGETLNKKQAKNRWINSVVRDASQAQSQYKKSNKRTGGGSNCTAAPTDLQNMVLDAARKIDVEFQTDYDQEAKAIKERSTKRSLQDELESNA